VAAQGEPAGATDDADVVLRHPGRSIPPLGGRVEVARPPGTPRSAPRSGMAGTLAAMCGRYASIRTKVDLSSLFDAADETDGAELPPDYNIAPTDPVPIVRVAASGTGRGLAIARWGLLPHWAKDPRAGARMINARAETVATSTAFAASFAQRRCLVPADGWYEWRVVPGAARKRPYFMTSRTGEILAFAGIWARWRDRLTCSIVTMPAAGRLATVHDRMPLLLPPAAWARWLRGPADPAALLRPPPEDYVAALEIRPVGSAVGDVRNDGPELIARVPDAPDTGVPTISDALF
jgi:putative SOS response-associated peptidase YedK